MASPSNPSAENNASAGTDQSAQNTGTAQDGSSAQDVNVQNNIQNTDNNNNSDHHHGHHHHDGFGLGFGLGLGLGWGFGFGPGWGWGPGWGFGPGWGWGPGWGGVGFYNNYAFGPYRRFEGYYPLGGYPVGVATSPLALSPQRPTYIQQNNPSRASQPAPVQRSNYWYYCRNPEGYYPKVRECSGEWIKVPPLSRVN